MKKLLLGALALAFAGATAGAAEVPELITRLQDKDNDVRRAAARELGEIGPPAKDAVPALGKALKDSDKFVRRFAAQALGAIGPDARGAVPELRNALAKDSAREVHLAAVVALGKIGYTSESLQALVAAVKDPAKDADVRRLAAEALGKFGKDAAPAVKPLTAALTDSPKGGKKKPSEGDIRLSVVTALGEIATADDKETIAAIENLTDKKQRDKVLRDAATQALKKIKARKAV